MGRGRKHTPSEAQQLLALNNDWKIDFESMKTPDQWDLPNKHLLEQILEITAVTFDGYPMGKRSDNDAAARKKLLVRRLQANVARCSREEDNEAGWINNVANLVFESLNGFEFQCQACAAYLWLPDFVALPGDREAARKLLQDYRQREICKCSAVQRASKVRVDVGSPSLFSNKSDERVFHESAGLPRVMIDQKYKRPDRVYGLSLTGSFNRFKSRLSKYSPFASKHTLFPFMVVEAKSARSSSSWEDIQQQTALSIRTCLKIQTDLEMASGKALDPVVWFFGFRGPYWHLYMALPVYDRTKIVRCWHGFLSDEKDVLQLLLIVDWICFWARDVYREAVLQCLFEMELRNTTPAATVFSSQGEWTVEGNTVRSRSLALRPPRSAIPDTQDDARQTVSTTLDGVHRLEDEIMSDILTSDGPGHEDDEVYYNVVQNGRDVTFRWNSFALPEHETVMLDLLSDIADGDSVQSIARALLRMLNDDNRTVKMSLESLSELLHMSTEQEEMPTEQPVAVFLACQYRLTEANWQSVCTYWCVSCSQIAAQVLAKIADVSVAEVFSLNYWRAHDCVCLVSVIAAFQNLGEKASAAAAIFNEMYYIRPSTSDPTSCHAEWSNGDGDTIQPRVAMLKALFKHVEGAQQTSLPTAARRTPVKGHLPSSQLFATDDLGQGPGVIIKRPESWPATCPPWCFITFEHGRHDSIGQQIALALQQRAIYSVNGTDADDKQSIQKWASAMEHVIPSVDASH